MNKNLYYQNLDGLRFFSFFSVFCFHNFSSNFTLLNKSHFYNFIRGDVVDNGSLGVNFFFVLSGFLITTLLIAEKKLNGNINLKFFWFRRVLRIWPLFYTCVFIGFIVYPFLKKFTGQLSTETADPLLCLTFLNNFDILKNGWPDASILGVLWSVAIEEQFYLVWPIILFIVPVKKLWIPFGLILVINLTFRAVYNTHLMHYYHTISCIGDMTVGGIGAWLIDVSPKFKKYFNDLNRITIYVVYLLFVGIYFFADQFQHNNAVSIFERLFIAMVFITIILEQTFSANSFYKMGNFKRISKLGTITYGLYCLHFLGILVATTVVNKLHINKHEWQIFFIEAPLALLISLILSTISYKVLESPFLKLKNKIAYVKEKKHASFTT